MVTLVVTDILMLGLALALAYLARLHTPLGAFQDGFVPDPTFYARLSLALVPLWLACFWVYRLYDWDKVLGGLQEYTAVFQAAAAGAIVVAMAQFFSNELVLARRSVGLTWVLVFVLVAVGRFLVRRVAYAARARGYLLSPALIVGANAEGRLLGQQLLGWSASGLNVLGYLDDDLTPGARVQGNLHVLGPVSDLGKYVDQYDIEELVLTSSALSRQAVLDIFRAFGTSPRVHLRLSSGLFDLLTTGLYVKELAYVPLINVNRVRLNGTEVAFKTVLDYAMSLAALVCLAPVLLGIALLVKLDSPGPVLYRRRVMGLNGREFDALKFRTMRSDGDAILAATPTLMDELATTHKLKGDPRITRVGWFLRKYSLDELPQLLNVLKRDMSLIGPRMISPPELAKYGQWGMNLLTVRPGITGLWQVSGRSDVSYEERVRLDMHYIRNYSIWLDLQILWHTIPVVLSGKGAY